MKQLFRGLFWAACILCISSIAMLTGYYQLQRKARQEYQELMESVVAIRQPGQETDKSSHKQSDHHLKENCVQAGDLENPPVLFVDFERLLKINEDTVAWIDFPGQGISYPIVQGRDNSHYLNYTFEGKRNGAGCIFLDIRNHGLMTDDNTIIYGHNMRNGSMFGRMKDYLEQSHYEEFPFFDIYTPENVYRCEIIACCRVRATGDNYPVTFSGDLDREAFIQGIKDKSEYAIQLPQPSGQSDIGHSVPSDPLIMLSTCVGGQKQYRFVLLARAVRVEE